MKVAISEIFESIQLEGRNVWKPSVFVRFWWCNLSCSWCDTKYAWDEKIEKANMLDLNNIVDKIKTFSSKHIIFTWWEPTLFQEYMYLISKKLGNEYTYELETNWSIELDGKLYFEQINISPKLSNSWNNFYKLEILNNIKNYAKNIDFKFVALDKEDLKEIEEYLSKINYKDVINWIYIMPLWTTKESQNNKIVLNYCIKKWYNYCLRQHIILFWDKKWV